MSTTGERLDVALVSRGLVETREKAQRLIQVGVVFVNDQRSDKPGTRVRATDKLFVKADPCPYVSRGGIKLAAALDHFEVNPLNRICVDIGASTGGFTDCLLQRGAQRIWAIDVGHNQLDYRIRTDSRVWVLERLNIRHIDQHGAYQQITESSPTLFVCDLSFISLRLVLPIVREMIPRDGHLICLVKPQFEVGREHVGKGGIVRDEAQRVAAVQGIVDFGKSLKLTVSDPIESPIQGAKGNIEYLIHGRPRPNDIG
ncbi:MAG: TlyA family RNA methyltransferase [Myxococcales bacterium]|nr:TlyA family RNA methyltransferase [Myxococcales bacterium]